MLPPILVFLVYLGLTVTLQFLAGAYVADLAGEDEAAHYVTGLMLRAFLISGQWLEPMEFARAYYAAYPKVAIGHWPPMFYLAQAIWTLVFTASRESVLLFMGVLAAGCASVSYRLFSTVLGKTTAAAAGLLFLCVPVVQALSSAVMAEMLVLAWTLLALSAYAKYLDSGRAINSLLFGLLASAAILTKANGLALALVPPLAVLLVRKTGLMRRFSFWVPLAVVAITCAPWYLFTLPAAKEGWQGSKSPKFLLGTVALFNLGAVPQQVGWIALLLATLGCYAMVVRPLLDRRAVDPVWAIAAATLVATLVFHSVIAPVRDARHLLAAILPTIFFAARGLLYGIQVVPVLSRNPARAAMLGGAVAVTAFGFESSRLFQKPTLGASEVAATLTSDPYQRSSILIVSPGAVGEGAIIAEIALRSPRPIRRLIRGSKLLAAMNWDGRAYRLLTQHPADVLRVLSDAGVELVVWQRPSANDPQTPHHLQVADAFRVYPDRFKQVIIAGSSNRFDVYEIVEPTTK